MAWKEEGRSRKCCKQCCYNVDDCICFRGGCSVHDSDCCVAESASCRLDDSIFLKLMLMTMVVARMIIVYVVVLLIQMFVVLLIVVIADCCIVDDAA